MTYTITDNVDTTDLGKIQDDNDDGTAGVTPLALPDQETSATILFPTTGPVRRFNITWQWIYVT